MDFYLLSFNLSNPTLLFFLLGVVAFLLKSDLEIPKGSKQFISLYLLFSIGFNGGQELSHSGLNPEVIRTMLFGLAFAAIIPCYGFFILKQRLSAVDAGAIAAAYGSVSAVTFVTAVAFLEMQQVSYGGHMVAVMASMEFPAIVMGVLLIKLYDKNPDGASMGLGGILKHSFSNGSVLMIVGSLVVGLLADTKQSEGITHFTTDIFKGFLAIYLLDMGMLAAQRFNAFRKQGLFVLIFSIAFPCFNGCMAAYLSGFVSDSLGNRLMLSVLAGSASYIAVPAAMRLAAPKADPGLYVPMALGITFPFNISVGLPLYYLLIQA